MGSKWTTKRLQALGNRYIKVAQLENIIIKKQPSRLIKLPNQIIADLPNGNKGIFWRENTKQSWKFDGNKSDLNLAQKNILRDGKYIKAAGDNKIVFRRRLIEVRPTKGAYELIIKDASDLDKNISQARLKSYDIIKIQAGKNIKNLAKNEIAKQIKSKLKFLNDKECELLAAKIVQKEKQLIPKNNYSYARNFTVNTLIGGGIGVVISLGAELISNGDNTNFEELTKAGGLGFAAGASSVAVGQLVTTSLIRNKVANSIVTQTATSLGVSPGFLRSSIATSVGAGVAVLIFSYGEYFMGNCDSYTANKNAVCGTAGVATGAATSAGVLFLVGTFGTAGTGTAIGGLSGAAAANASLAWLGGGTLASGGLGVAGGSIILSGGAAIVIIGATAAAMYGFSLYEKSEQRKLMEKELNYYLASNFFEKKAEKMFPYVSN